MDEVRPDILFQCARSRVAIWPREQRGGILQETPVKVSLYHEDFGTQVPYVHLSATEARKMGEALIEASNRALYI